LLTMQRARVVTRLGHRSVDWASLSSKVQSDAARSEVARLRQLYDEISAQNRAIPEAVAPIDFSHYRSVIKSPGIVDEMEKAYNALNLPAFVASEIDEADAQFDQLIADAQSSVESSHARIEELESVLETMTSAKLSKDTTVEEMYERYPEVGEEIEAEINAMDWKKDT